MRINNYEINKQFYDNINNTMNAIDYRYIDTQLGMHPAYVFPKIFNRMLTVLHS